MDIKLLSPIARTPTKAHDVDAGWDMYVAETWREGRQMVVDFAVAFDIPAGYVGLVFPRSSIKKTSVRLSNCVGVIDSGYHGSVKAYFDDTLPDQRTYYAVGDRAAQIVFVPLAEVKELTVVEEFKERSERGDGGFGSSGS